MLLGIEVPSVYIVPVERFCREMGPALGINLAEFEFPAYFNYFVRGKRCTLVVDSGDAEQEIRHVFGETLLGPEVFRQEDHPIANENEDFDPSFPTDARPNFYKEFYNFRTAEKSTNYRELTIDTLLDFCHFKHREPGQKFSDVLGVPPIPPEFEMDPIASERHRRERLSRRRASLTSGGSEAIGDEMLGAISENDVEITFSEEFQGQESLTRSNSIPDMTSHGSPDGERLDGRRGSLASNSMLQGSSHGKEPRRSSMPMFNDIQGSHRDSLGMESVNGGAQRNRRDSLGMESVSGQEGPGGRRGSVVSVDSEISAYTSRSRQSFSSHSVSPYDFLTEDETSLQDSNWMYSQARWLGESVQIVLKIIFLKLFPIPNVIPIRKFQAKLPPCTQLAPPRRRKGQIPVRESRYSKWLGGQNISSMT